MFFGKLVSNQSCVPNLKVLASTVAKIRRGSHILFGCSLGPDPATFVLNVVFGKLVPNPSCIPNLKLLALTVAKIRRGFQFFFDAPLAQTIANFGMKRCFLISYSKPKLCTKFEVASFNGCRNK